MEQTAYQMKAIAHIHNDFSTKFAVPRQSGVAPSLMSAIVFEREYQAEEAFRGIEEFSHLWLLWCFDKAEGWSPTVRPPRLGGNRRVGVFATRSPFRPNHIGLTCVKLCSVEKTEKNGIVLLVSGADMMDGTPILDVKPYIPYADVAENPVGGFTENTNRSPLQVYMPEELRNQLTSEKIQTLTEVLSQDPRPAYQHDPERVYGFPYGEYEVRFRGDGTSITVVSVEERRK